MNFDLIKIVYNTKVGSYHKVWHCAKVKYFVVLAIRHVHFIFQIVVMRVNSLGILLWKVAGRTYLQVHWCSFMFAAKCDLILLYNL